MNASSTHRLNLACDLLDCYHKICPIHSLDQNTT
uniref:Uncharacterized protein n=1 Tax=Anguilla anguilla TaxID=7936 RepID=A0A0E9W1M1_ANGAN